jgi:uncharacterized protein YyaL (SSP411 family)
MLYDNALLVPCYLDAYLLTGDDDYARVARETLDYLLREMHGERGGFHSSQDADSEGVEGKFFVWDRAEVEQLLGADAGLAAARWGITVAGNWEGHNVLFLAKDLAALAVAHDLEPAAAAARLQGARERLYAVRSKRVRPGTDDKVLTAWNALAIAACARGHQVLGEGRYLAAAQAAADFVLRELVVDGRCKRSWHSGQALHQGYLEDHAFLAEALLTLFESDFDPRWLAASNRLLAVIRAHFTDPADGNLYFTADDHEDLLARSKSAVEASTPSGIAVAVRALLRGGLLLGDEELYEAGVAVLRSNHGLLDRSPIAAPSLVLALQFHLADPREIVIAGALDDPRTQALLARARQRFPAPFVAAVVHDGNRQALAELSKVFAGKVPLEGVPAAYVCRRGVCGAPVVDPARLLP